MILTIAVSSDKKALDDLAAEYRRGLPMPFLGRNHDRIGTVTRVFRRGNVLYCSGEMVPEDFADAINGGRSC